MREILDLTGHSLLAQRAELSKPPQALCTNWFIAFSTGFAHISKNQSMYICCWNSSAHCKEQLILFWNG